MLLSSVHVYIVKNTDVFRNAAIIVFIYFFFQYLAWAVCYDYGLSWNNSCLVLHKFNLWCMCIFFGSGYFQLTGNSQKT